MIKTEELCNRGTVKSTSLKLKRKTRFWTTIPQIHDSTIPQNLNHVNSNQSRKPLQTLPPRRGGCEFGIVCETYPEPSTRTMTTCKLHRLCIIFVAFWAKFRRSNFQSVTDRAKLREEGVGLCVECFSQAENGA
jgi:hypothetical protein